MVADGEVYAWGKARYGQLGFGYIFPLARFSVLAQALSSVAFCFLVVSHSGKNWDQMNPRQIPTLLSIKIQQVACGECHSLALAG